MRTVLVCDHHWVQLTTSSSSCFHGTHKHLKRYEPTTYSASQWSEDATLQGSLACTDWSVFDEENLNMKVKVISDYIKFCMTTTIPAIIVKKYPNSRPWMTSQIKLMLTEKQQALLCKDWLRLRDINRSVKNEITKSKLVYKNKLERDFSSMNTRQAFQKVRTLTGTTSRTCTSPTDHISFTVVLKNFFANFDKATTLPSVRDC